MWQAFERDLSCVDGKTTRCSFKLFIFICLDMLVAEMGQPPWCLVAVACLSYPAGHLHCSEYPPAITVARANRT